ncbi:nascent polypeptide-associated complex protein [Candidatus Woesearchaeota archaeon]|nr:nascent polypeptide-associated complex protein [Candidatus Woesearchaeota archaeon]
MLPGMNMKNMAKAMKRMGIKQNELNVKQVIMKLEDKELVFDNPQVSQVNMMGQKTYQVVGEPQERSLDEKPEISEEDLKVVIEQTGKTIEEAKAAIEKHKGDLAAAIMELKE